jgi:hypothetical protein
MQITHAACDWLEILIVYWSNQITFLGFCENDQMQNSPKVH